MKKNKIIKDFMEKNLVKSDDLAVHLNITKGIMSNILIGTRKVHSEEWKKFLKTRVMLKSQGKLYFEDISTKKSKYLFPIEIKLPRFANSWTDIKIVRQRLKNKNLWEIGKKIQLREKGRRDITYIDLNNKNIFNLLGWILTEGHIPKSDRIIHISQKDENVLKRLKENIKDITQNSNIVKGNKSYSLDIISGPLRFFYLDYFNVPPGTKSDIIEIPKVITQVEKEKKYSFIGGLEGDMHFSITKRKDDSFLSPSIGLSSKNKRFIIQFQKLLHDIGIQSSVSEKRNRENKMYVSVIGSINSTVKYFHYISPYILSNKNRTRLIYILSQRQILNSLRLSKKECNNIKSISIKVRDIVSNEGVKISYEQLSKKLNEEFKLKVKGTTIESWIFKDTRIPLSFIILSSKINLTPISKIVPEWVKSLLIIHNLLQEEKFKPIQDKSKVSEVLPSWIYSLDHICLDHLQQKS